jgi:phosphatidate cytidylyltransferase
MMHRQRILSALVFIPLFYILVRYGSPDLFFFILSLSILLGLREFFALLEARGIRPLRALGFVGGWTLSFLIYNAGPDRDDLLLFLALLVGSFLVALLSTKEDFGDRIQGAGATLLGILYLSLLLSFIALLRKLPGGETYIYYLFAVTWAGDAGAFYFGIRFGQHRLCPTLSPGKSVEGSIAGLVCSLAASLLAKWTFFYRLPNWHALVLGVLLGVAAQLGDLSESLLKRSLAVKDSGSLIPGHGGFLDRVDSLLFTGPFLYFYVSHCVC